MSKPKYEVLHAANILGLCSIVFTTGRFCITLSLVMQLGICIPATSSGNANLQLLTSCVLSACEDLVNPRVLSFEHHPLDHTASL